MFEYLYIDQHIWHALSLGLFSDVSFLLPELYIPDVVAHAEHHIPEHTDSVCIFRGRITCLRIYARIESYLLVLTSSLCSFLAFWILHFSEYYTFTTYSVSIAVILIMECTAFVQYSFQLDCDNKCAVQRVQGILVVALVYVTESGTPDFFPQQEIIHENDVCVSKTAWK